MQINCFVFYFEIQKSTSTAASTGTSASQSDPKSVSKAKTDPNAADDDLNSKLCTFTVTKKDFKNQHWYYCHTCKMVERIGMCTICAKVCHKDHDVSYAKYGSFFCDCGAKEDGSCIAMTKRTAPPAAAAPKVDPKKEPKKINVKKLQAPQKKKTKSNSVSSASKLDANVAKVAEIKDKDVEFLCELSKQSTVELLRRILAQIRVNKSKQLEKLRTQLVECVKAKDLLRTIRHLLDATLIPLAKVTYDNSLLNTNSSLARCELAKLKHQKLSIPTLKQLSHASSIAVSQEEDKEKSQTAVSIRPSNVEQQPLFIVTLGIHLRFFFYSFQS